MLFSALKRTVDATTEPVTLDEAKAFARVTASDENALLTSLIKTARQECEKYSGRAFITQTWRASFKWLEDDRVLLPYPTLISISNIQYKNDSGLLVTVDSSDYEADTDSDRPAVRFLTIPPFSLKYLNPIRVTYTSGFGPTAADVPDDIQTAIKATVTAWFYSREATQIPQGAKNILNHYHPYTV